MTMDAKKRPRTGPNLHIPWSQIKQLLEPGEHHRAGLKHRDITDSEIHDLNIKLQRLFIGPNLEYLPTELLHHIVDYLEPTLPPNGPHPHRCKDAWIDFFQKRNALLNLCITSKRMSEVALSRVYRVVHIRDPVELHLLLRTLLQHPELAISVESILCSVDFQELELESMYDSWKSVWHTFSAPEYQEGPKSFADWAMRMVHQRLVYQNLVGLVRSERPQDLKKYTAVILHTLLCCTPRLKHFRLKVPCPVAEELHAPHDRQTSDPLRLLLFSLPADIEKLMVPLHQSSHMLPNCFTASIPGKRRRSDDDSEEEDQVESLYTGPDSLINRPFAQLENLEIECTTQNGPSDYLNIEILGASGPTGSLLMRARGVQASVAGTVAIRHLLVALANHSNTVLSKLDIQAYRISNPAADLRHSQLPIGVPGTNNNSSNLNRSLLSLASVQELRLDLMVAMYSTPFISLNLGLDASLSGLQYLTNLTTLTLTLQGAFGDLSALEDLIDMYVPDVEGPDLLFQRFPASLVRLELIEWWDFWGHQDTQVQSMFQNDRHCQAVESLLRLLPLNIRQKLPQLRQLLFVGLGTHSVDGPASTWTRTSTEEWQIPFHEVGVQFGFILHIRSRNHLGDR